MKRRSFLKMSAGMAAYSAVPALRRTRAEANVAAVDTVDANAPVVNTAEAAFPVSMTVDAHTPQGEWRPVWRFFGYDEPNFTYMKDGRKLLAELGKLGSPQVYIRTHQLLTSGDGTPALKWGSTNAYTEDAHGNAVYDWTLTDRIFDTYLKRGLKPYVQI